jgi:large subunit ribosomal protein L29
MKAKDLRDRSTEDLRELRGVLQKELFGNRMKNFTSQLDDTSQLGRARRDIARIDTILSERSRAESAQAGGTES